MAIKENKSQTITENERYVETIPIRANNNILSDSICAGKAIYRLTYEQFIFIKHNFSDWYKFSSYVFSSSIGLILMVLAKVILKRKDTKVNISKVEIYAIAIAILISIVALMIGKCFPTKRRKILKEIDRHFENEPTQYFQQESNKNDA